MPDAIAHGRASELADRERLRDVVVRTELEPEHLVELVVARGEHEIGTVLVARSRLQTSSPSSLGSIRSSTTRSMGCSEKRCSALPVASLDNNVPVLLEREREDGRTASRRRPAESWGVVGHRRSGAARIAPEMAPPAAAPGADRRTSGERPPHRGSFASLRSPSFSSRSRSCGRRRFLRRCCRPTSTARRRARSRRTSPATTPTARPEAPGHCSPPHGSATRCGSTTCRSRRPPGRRRSRGAGGRGCRTCGPSHAGNRARDAVMAHVMTRMSRQHNATGRPPRRLARVRPGRRRPARASGRALRSCSSPPTLARSAGSVHAVRSARAVPRRAAIDPTRSAGKACRGSRSRATRLAHLRRACPDGRPQDRRAAGPPGRPSVVAQLIDLGFPFTLYDQGPFVARGIPP